jgi:glycosyltransferase involved in cell wall biosynthesis
VHDLPLVGLGNRLKKRFNIKLTADLHENWPAFVAISKHTNTLAGKVFSPVFLWRNYEKRELLKADNVIVVVDEAKIRLTNLGIPASKIHVVSNTINFSELKLQVTGNTSGNILYYAGGINHHRGLQNIIKAIGKSHNKKLIFWILGEGSYKEELETLVKALALEKQVIFQGYKSFSVVMQMLSEADFAVIPHLKNEHTDSTIPHKLFQYMFLRKPVIASNCTPIKRILEKTGSGIVYPFDQVDQLAKIFDNLNNFDMVKMGQNGEMAVRNLYNWENDSKILAAIYQS